jgi:gamma-butyrobetaine dioxygenase
MTVRADLAGDGRAVCLVWPDGLRREVGAIWLFDHADDARDPVSGQRGHGALALDGLPRIDAVEIDGPELKARFSPPGLERRIRLDRLRGEGGPSLELWPEPGDVAGPPPLPFQDYLDDDAALRAALSQLARRGLVFLEGAGGDLEAVERVVQRFGFVRETNYGRIFDVRIEPAPGNLAFTGRGLELHTDNPYRDPTPTLQLLHAIVMDDGGGETLFVDGFAHAEALRREVPDAFDILAHEPVRFTYAASSGARWSAQWPILDVDAKGAIRAVRLNHRSLDLALAEAEATERWYGAYLAFYRRLHVPEAALERRLKPGEVVIFDNRRILHGRRALTSGSPRWLKGCYADSDGVAATLARLDRGADQESF